MFERFTDRARRAIVLAQEEARMLKHDHIGTEHILLGLIHEGEGVAARVLESLGISLLGVRSQVEEVGQQGEQALSGHIPFTLQAKELLQLSLREALRLGDNYIGTEHLLLGLIREGQGFGARIIVRHEVELPRARSEVFRVLSTHAETDAAFTVNAYPETVAERLARISAAKEAAIDEQDFERAAYLRDREKAFRAARRTVNRTADYPADRTAVPTGLGGAIRTERERQGGAEAVLEGAHASHRLSESEITTLALIYTSRLGAEQLLARAGFPSGRLPSWNAGNPLEFWREVARLVEHGILDGARTAILEVAHNDFPANPVLRAAVAGA